MKAVAIIIMILTLPFTFIGFILSMIEYGIRAGRGNYDDLHKYISSKL